MHYKCLIDTCVWQADANIALNGVTKETERGPVITFTIGDTDKTMTVDEVGKISSPEFQRLYSVSLLPLHASTFDHAAVCGMSNLPDVVLFGACNLTSFGLHDIKITTSNTNKTMTVDQVGKILSPEFQILY